MQDFGQWKQRYSKLLLKDIPIKWIWVAKPLCKAKIQVHYTGYWLLNCKIWILKPPLQRLLLLHLLWCEIIVIIVYFCLTNRHKLKTLTTHIYQSTISMIRIVSPDSLGFLQGCNQSSNWTVFSSAGLTGEDLLSLLSKLTQAVMQSIALTFSWL